MRATIFYKKKKPLEIRPQRKNKEDHLKQKRITKILLSNWNCNM